MRPAWVVPTAAGLAFAGLPYLPWRPAYGRLAHVHAVSVVRLALEVAAPGVPHRRSPPKRDPAPGSGPSPR